MRIRIHFSRGRKNPGWLLRLARNMGALYRAIENYLWFRRQMNHSHGEAWKNANNTVTWRAR